MVITFYILLINITLSFNINEEIAQKSLSNKQIINVNNSIIDDIKGFIR